MTERAHTSLDGPGPAPLVGPASGGAAPAHPVLSLQRAAGNAAVANLLQRSAFKRGPDKKVNAVELTVGDDIPLRLAEKAKTAAAAGITDAELRSLRADALGDDTISDYERMFLAALLDAGNARKVAATTMAAGTTLVFDRATIDANMARARDIDQAVKDPAIAAALAKEAAATTFAERMKHYKDASAAIFAQVVALTGPAFQDKALDAFSYAIGKIPLDEVLEAMLAAASDDTPGDRALAAVVYVAAAEAGHPMAPLVRSGKIKVDQVASLPGNDWAGYRPTAGGLDGAKGDTVLVRSALNIDDVAHRSVVIHELTHAAQDAGVTTGKVEDLDRERSEMEAYRTGARYQLEQVAPLTMIPRYFAVQQIGALNSPPAFIAMVLESRANRKEYEPVVYEVNRASRGAAKDRDIAKLLQAGDVHLERGLYDIIGRAYGTRDKRTGSRIPGGNALPADGLGGESILDWIDKT